MTSVFLGGTIIPSSSTVNTLLSFPFVLRPKERDNDKLNASSCSLLRIRVRRTGTTFFFKQIFRYIEIKIYRVSQEECARLREGVPCGKVYRYNPKQLCPKLNGYGDNGQRKVWSSSGSTHCGYRLTRLINVCPRVWYGVTSLLASDVSCIALGNPKDNYDAECQLFVVQFNGFMSLTS
jgi:hypothetical protein